MTDEAKKAVLSAMVGETDETVLSAYLSLAASKVLLRAYPFDSTVTEVPERYSAVQVQIAAYMLNKRGAEGQTSHSENGISRGYEDGDVPPSLLREIVPVVGSFYRKEEPPVDGGEEPGDGTEGGTDADDETQPDPV